LQHLLLVVGLGAALALMSDLSTPACPRPWAADMRGTQGLKADAAEIGACAGGLAFCDGGLALLGLAILQQDGTTVGTPQCQAVQNRHDVNAGVSYLVDAALSACSISCQVLSVCCIQLGSAGAQHGEERSRLSQGVPLAVDEAAKLPAGGQTIMVQASGAHPIRQFGTTNG
jgi:hypothetical protein